MERTTPHGNSSIEKTDAPPIHRSPLAKVWSIVRFLWEGVILSWAKWFWPWDRTKSDREQQLDAIGMAQEYEDWITAGEKLDGILGYRKWREEADAGTKYAWRHIQNRYKALNDAREKGDPTNLANIMRSGLVRNLGNITTVSLYNRAYAGTKCLIEDYIGLSIACVDMIAEAPTTTTSETGLTKQTKLSILHDMKRAYGQSALLLQGGAVFGLCHLGVVKALHLRGLLPKVISGTATGALIAALVGVHTDSELLGVLSGSSINVDAFTNRATSSDSTQSRWYQTLIRRLRRWWATGHFLDIEVLEKLLEANIGDLTFAEAHKKTGRILNITVTTNTSAPTALNYITAPYVLVRSAALASISSSSSTLYKPVTILSKDLKDNIVPWPLAVPVSTEPRPRHWQHDRQSPLLRLRELFSVNHYIVSQARPFLTPFLRTDLHHPNPRHEGRFNYLTPILRFYAMQVQHYLTLLDKFGLVPESTRRFLLDEDIPGHKLLLVPEVGPRDFVKLLENPNKSAIDYWIHKGERSVWPAVSALNIRCGIEMALDRGYEAVKRRPKSAATNGSGNANGNGNGVHH